MSLRARFFFFSRIARSLFFHARIVFVNVRARASEYRYNITPLKVKEKYYFHIKIGEKPINGVQDLLEEDFTEFICKCGSCESRGFYLFLSRWSLFLVF